MTTQWKSMSLLAALCILASGLVRAEPDFSKATASSGPPWLRNGVIYEIFPRDFSPAGDLNGVTARLDALRELGVTILWVMPINPIGEKGRKGTFGSPYSVRDYYAVNPDYGTLADFQRLVAETHKRGMKLILDVVLNHTSWDSVLMAHPEFYKHNSHGNIIPPDPAWNDVAALDYSNPKLREYMIDLLKYWVKECDVDGFRCDVAFMVPTDFWIQAREALTQVKPDLMWLAEADKPELLVKAFDIDYSWPLMSTLNDVLMQSAPAKRLESSYEDTLRQFPRGALHMRISDDHDEARAIARFGVNGAVAASALMFTLDGVPLLYNGMEVGDATESGDPALFEKLPVFWHPKGRPQLRQIYRSLIQLREKNAAFRDSAVEWLANSDEKDLVTFLRADDKDAFLVVINFSNRPVSGSVNVKNGEDFQPVPISGFTDSSPGDLPHFRLNGFGWRIYHRSAAQN
jgi:cyclomaltodextrinase / maltogenic alpha-amylase / neopullulanase